MERPPTDHGLIFIYREIVQIIPFGVYTLIYDADALSDALSHESERRYFLELNHNFDTLIIYHIQAAEYVRE